MKSSFPLSLRILRSLSLREFFVPSVSVKSSFPLSLRTLRFLCLAVSGLTGKLTVSHEAVAAAFYSDGQGGTPNRGPFARTGCPQRATRSQTVNYQHCSARDTTTFTACCVSGSIPALEKTVAVNVTILLMLISGQLRIGFSFSSCNSIVTSDWTVVVRKKRQQ